MSRSKATGADGVNAVGYCVGGTILSVSLAYMAATGDDRIKSATFFATQVDFSHAGDLKIFVDEEQIADLEYKMKMRGYLEGKEMANAFNMLRPNDLIWPYVIGNYFKGKEPPPFDLLYWNSDATRMPAANHAFYLRHCYLENQLSAGEMEVAGVKLDLKKVKIPIYNLATREDHIAPPESVFFGSSSFGGKVTFVVTGSGHIAGVINPPARNKYQYWTGPAPKGDNYAAWIKKAKEHPGSWWPHWQAWIEAKDKRRVPADPPRREEVQDDRSRPGQLRAGEGVSAHALGAACPRRGDGGSPAEITREDTAMTIAIIGTGRMAEGLGKRLVHGGEAVTLAGRDAKKTAAAASRIGASTGLIPDAAKAEIVILAIPHPATADTLTAAGDLSGKIIVDITNPVGPELSLAVGLTTSAAEEIQKQVPKAKVVKAFNTIFAELLGLELGPDDIPPQVLYAGDDQAAKERVAGMIRAIGFEPLDAGPLRNARFIEPIALMAINFGYALGQGTRISPRFVKY